MDPVAAQLIGDSLNSVLNVIQILVLAWIGAEQAASSRERRRRRADEDDVAESMPDPDPTLAERQRFGRNVRRRRLRLGYTQYDLSSITGLSQHTISTVETAAHPHQPFTLGVIAEALRIDPEALWED